LPLRAAPLRSRQGTATAKSPRRARSFGSPGVRADRFGSRALPCGARQWLDRGRQKRPAHPLCRAHLIETTAFPLSSRTPGSAPALTETKQKLRRKQRDVMARGAIDLHEVAQPEILDPRGVEGEHPRRSGFLVCSKEARKLGGLNGQHDGGLEQVDQGEPHSSGIPALRRPACGSSSCRLASCQPQAR
jgi:hypothetical protein